jgi:alpha-2-macroglobulin
MWFALRALVAGLVVLLAQGVEAEEKRFSHAGIHADAKRYETSLQASPRSSNRLGAEPRVDADRRIGKDPRAASLAYVQAVLADANDAAAWLGLARALLSINPERASERYELPVNASGAAFNAYERATLPAVKAAALTVLADALRRRSLFRPALDALSISLTLVDAGETREVYEKLLAEHGFRILEYKVDADASQPRLCVQFSERLAAGRSDWAEFIKLDGKDPQTVTADQRQICVDGLAHGKRYEVQVRMGLPSAVGETLRKTAELGIYVKDRTPSVRASGRGYVLPTRGQQGIPLISVNTDTLKVEVYRIGDRNLAQTLQSGDFQKQISAYEIETLKERSGARVYVGELAVATRPNEDVTTAFPVADALPRLQPGVYVLVAQSGSKEEPGRAAAAIQWFIVSDLGLTTINGEDGLHVFVRSLAMATPVVNANLRLLARNNEVLGTTRTDSRGYARFDAGLQRGEGGLAPAVLAAEAADGDYAFIDVAGAAFDLTDRGVKGRSAPGPIDAFAYTERGVYRPGETVHLVALARNRLGHAASIPLTLVIARPDGVEHKRTTLPDQGLGARATELALPPTAMTGTWRVRVHAEPKASAIAQTAFLVEDFVPERLDLKLEPAVSALSLDQLSMINLAGRYLYGPPAAGLAVEGEIVVKPSTREAAGFPGFKFGLADEQMSPVRKTLEQLPATDAQGRATIGVRLPALPRTARPLDADVILKLRESGGRTIERTVTLPVELPHPRIGIKPLFAGGQIGEGEMARFELVLLGADGRPIEPQGLTWELLRLDQRWQWYSRDGSWNYEPVVSARRVAAGTAEASGTLARIEARVDWGRYRLEVASADGTLSSLIFNGGYWADEAADSPEILDVALDKPAYRAGETARLKIQSRLAGRAMIAVLNSGLASQQEVELPAGGGEVPLPVNEAWGPGVYVTVMLYRPMEEKAKRMPSRAVGLRWLAIDQAPRLLSIGLDLPPQIRSGATLSVPVKVGGLAAGEDAFLTLAAVDVGVLNLTRFETPKPEAWFFGQRRLGAEIRDLYGRLIDGMRAERGRLRSGGDAGSDGMSLAGSPPVEATLALFSGLVRLDANGHGKVDFQLPDFNGAVRILAVAWSGSKIGSAAKDLMVRDPVTVTASAPRFLTLGDQARLELAVHNVEGVPGQYTIVGEIVGAAELDATAAGARGTGFERSVVLAAGERRRETFELKPQQVGRIELALRVRGPNGVEVRRRLAFDVKVPAGDVKRLTVAALAPRGGKLTLSRALLQDLIPTRSKISLSVGPLAGFDVPGLLASLDRYPYGCAEQTTSRALPLLYVNEVSKRIGMSNDAQIRQLIDGAIARVFEMQDSAGAFGIWGPSDGDMWLTSYVTDFLTRAREVGYAVRQQPFSRALDRLQNFISYAQDFEKGGEGRAYALYVLARNGRAPIGELRYYVDTKLHAFSTPLAQAQLAAALAMLGDKPRAELAMQAALKLMQEREDAESRRDYGSGMRDGAAVLALVAESGIAKPVLPRLIGVLAEAYAKKPYTSTQEQAWLLLATHALGEEANSLSLAINGQPHQGSLLRGINAAELDGEGVVVSNTSETGVEAVISVVGAALTPEPAIAKGFSIERSYYMLDGRKVDLKSAAGGRSELTQNDRLVVVLKVEAEQAGGRILLVDRLPAGLEIENPRLVDAGDVKTLGWLKTTLQPNHLDFRDDRFVAAFDFFGASNARRGRSGDGEDGNAEPVSSASVAYLVRAVTPGTFVHPAATVEDMYRPDRFARTPSGQLVVVAKD